jgi:hypothetical protein
MCTATTTATGRAATARATGRIPTTARVAFAAAVGHKPQAKPSQNDLNKQYQARERSNQRSQSYQRSQRSGGARVVADGAGKPRSHGNGFT